MRARLAPLAPLALLLVAAPARAQKLDLPPPKEDNPPLSLLPDHLVDRTMGRSWGDPPTRTFFSTQVDVGYVYIRPRLALGYGRPFTSWLGVEVNPLAQTAGLGGYGGVRFSLPWLDLRVGSRYFYSFLRSNLVPARSYSRLDLDLDTGTPTKILTHEAELTVTLPLGPGRVQLLGSYSYITGVPDGSYAFEETLHLIASPGSIWRGRAGYFLGLGSRGQFSVGLVAEALGAPSRDARVTVRTGPVMSLALSRRVDVRGCFVVSVVSPDTIGLVGGDFTELGLRYRWATE